MTGTLLNTGAILVGGGLGLLLGSKLSAKLKQTLITALGLFTLVYGVSMFLKTQNSLIVLGALVIGTLLGEWMHLEEGLTQLGAKLEHQFNHANGSEQQERFIKGFLAASLIFCVGPMAILGSIEDGLTGNFNTLAVKSILDGLTSMAFASSLGVGVLFSAPLVLIYQGAITLLAAQMQTFTTAAMMNELSAVGGVILVGIAISGLLEIKKIRTVSLLPALILAPLIVYIISLF
ncbi:MAG TPA: DUF554 domain-containing protein [Anaerolineaceae bacterium]|jgi:hypothetical protein|nr:DUF554 domain-containing protein [Anaerolineaceae bacterium]